MATPIAYGDSRTYFRARADSTLALQQAASTQSLMTSQYQNAMFNPYAGYQMRNASQLQARPAEWLAVKSPHRIIEDRGFGGAESRPRSRRYAT